MEKCKTLGEETYFEFSLVNNELLITYGFTLDEQKTVLIQNSLIISVINRVHYLKENDIEHYKTSSFYTITKWEKCPNTQYCPYVAKLVLDVFPEDLINNFLKK